MKETIEFFVELHTIITKYATVYQGITTVPNFESHWTSSPKAAILSKPSKQTLETMRNVGIHEFLFMDWDYRVEE